MKNRSTPIPSSVRRSRRRTEDDTARLVAMGQRLRWVRDALALSQQQIADALEMHQTTWSLYERGLRLPDQFEAMRLCSKLGLSLGYLLNGELDEVEHRLAVAIARDHPELERASDRALSKGKALAARS